MIKKHLQDDGFAVIKNFIDDVECESLENLIADVQASTESKAAGIRNLFQLCPELKIWVRSKVIRQLIDEILGPEAFAVRAILFDKSPSANWLVSWHQDLAIALKSRHDHQGYSGWSNKNDIVHVIPPSPILGKMVTLRIHLDDCLTEHGPLKVLKGSHCDGILDSEQIELAKQKYEEVECVVDKRACIVMSPLLLHASSKAITPSSRRVLHIEFADCKLPKPLEWQNQY